MCDAGKRFSRGRKKIARLSEIFGLGPNTHTHTTKEFCPPKKIIQSDREKRAKKTSLSCVCVRVVVLSRGQNSLSVCERSSLSKNKSNLFTRSTLSR